MSEDKRFTLMGKGIGDHHKKELHDFSTLDGLISVTKCMNELHEETEELKKENMELKKENIHLEDDLRYYKTKTASCEQGLIQYEYELNTYKRKLEEILRKWYADANKLRTPIRKLDYGKDIGYWNSIKEFIEELSDKLGVDLK